MEFIRVNERSKWLPHVQELGDQASATVGFLAKAAYYDYAQRGRILALIDGSELLAYIMYRYRKNAIVIVQLVVSSQHRHKGLAKQMVDKLFNDECENFTHMQLSCRRDYGIDHFWQSLGFVPVSEKAGRATTKDTILTIWIRNNPNCNSLFGVVNKTVDDRIRVILDTNIVIDLCGETNSESQSLKQNFLNDYADFRITRFVFYEINLNHNKSIRKIHREYASTHYQRIDSVDDNILQAVRIDLLSHRSADEFTNTWYDVSHIAEAIAGNAAVFITRDEAWLNTDIARYILQKYDLNIMSPGEFISTMDHLCTPSDYAPSRLAGLNLDFSKMQASDFSAVVNTFYQQYSSKKHFLEKDLREWMSHPAMFDILLIKSNGTPACLIVRKNEKAEQHIVTLQFNANTIRPSLQNTFIKRIAFKLLDDATKENIRHIIIPVALLSNSLSLAFTSCGFFEDSTNLVRTIDARIVHINDLDCLSEHGFTTPVAEAITQLKQQRLKSTSNENIVRLEKALWPLKISGTDIPSYLVPIQAEYARQLFDEKMCNEEPSLFTNEKMEPALSIENVYYKALKHSIPNGPARLLWYVSQSSYMYTGAVRAVSYLDEVDRGTCRELFKRYSRLGVLEWEALRKIGGGSGKVTAYSFSYTELLDTPVSLSKIRDIIKKPNETIQSFRKISDDDFFQIYKLGKRYS